MKERANDEQKINEEIEQQQFTNAETPHTEISGSGNILRA